MNRHPHAFLGGVLGGLILDRSALVILLIGLALGAAGGFAARELAGAYRWARRRLHWGGAGGALRLAKAVVAKRSDDPRACDRCGSELPFLTPAFAQLTWPRRIVKAALCAECAVWLALALVGREPRG